jgi:hypothetical protein
MVGANFPYAAGFRCPAVLVANRSDETIFAL